MTFNPPRLSAKQQRHLRGSHEIVWNSSFSKRLTAHDYALVRTALMPAPQTPTEPLEPSCSLSVR